MSDASVAEIARDLAKAMMDRAKSRSAEDTKRVAEISTALCQEVRFEQEAATQAREVEP